MILFLRESMETGLVLRNGFFNFLSEKYLRVTSLAARVDTKPKAAPIQISPKKCCMRYTLLNPIPIASISINRWILGCFEKMIEKAKHMENAVVV